MFYAVSLQDVFSSSTFKGNIKWMDKLNVVGMFMQAFISITTILAGSILIVRLLSTMIVLVNVNVFKALHEKKQVDSNESILTFFSSGIKTRVKSRGAQIVLDFLIALVPDFYKGSDLYEEEDKVFNVSSWVLNKIPSYSLAFLLLGMMWNGSMLQGIFMITDGMGAVAQSVVEYDLEGTVNNLLNKNIGGYKFSIGTTGTGVDYVQGEVASKVYKSVANFTSDLTVDEKLTVGNSIESTVSSVVNKEVIAKYSNPKIGDYSKLNDTDWKNVSTQVILSGSKSSANALVINGSDLGLKSIGDSKYVHVYFSYSPPKEKVNYWVVSGED